MKPSSEETPLEGGSLTSVVRVGDTVRREARDWSQTVQGFLRHLEACGFEGAPRALGFDELGREILSFVEGEVAVGLPSYIWESTVLVELAGLMRRYHDAAATFRPAAPRWQSAGIASAETICHNDIVPWNTVFRDGRPVAFIDWDFAAPGPRVADVAFTAWAYVPFWTDAKCEEYGLPRGTRVKGRRFRTFIGAYGGLDSGSVLTAGLTRMRAMVQHLDQLAAAGNAREVGLKEDGVIRGAVEEIAFVEEHYADLAASG